MLRIKQRGERLYIEGTYNGERIRKATFLGPKDKAAANKLREQMQQRLALGQPLDADKTTFNDLADIYLSRPQGVSEKTKRIVASLRRWWGRVQVAAWSPLLVDQYMRAEWYANGKPRVASATIRRHITQLRAVFGHAAEIGRIAAVPTIPLPPGGEGRDRFLTIAEIKTLVDTARTATPLIYPLVVFLLQTGARVGEAIDMVWPGTPGAHKAVLHLEGAEPYAAITSRKGSGGKRIRHVPLQPDTVAVLKALPHREGHVFKSSDGKKWTVVDSLYYHWNILRDQTGIDDVVIHDLRRTYASHLIMNGADLRTVQKLLGHTSLVMLDKHYGHLANQQLIAGASRVYTLDLANEPAPKH